MLCTDDIIKRTDYRSALFFVLENTHEFIGFGIIESSSFEENTINIEFEENTKIEFEENKEKNTKFIKANENKHIISIITGKEIMEIVKSQDIKYTTSCGKFDFDEAHQCMINKEDELNIKTNHKLKIKINHLNKCEKTRIKKLLNPTSIVKYILSLNFLY